MPLLSPNDPAPYHLLVARGDSPFLLTADHAGRAIPEQLGTLGLTPEDLSRHIAWDIGIAEVTLQLAQKLGAFMIAQRYSRLVVDCNRPLSAEGLAATLSEDTVIPGNQDLSAQQLDERVAEIFTPYHNCITAELNSRQEQAASTIYVAMHSFTPCYRGAQRRWECGVLYNRDPRFSQILFRLLQREGLVVGDNEPYFVSDDSDYGVPVHAEGRNLPYVELEIRQDLICSEADQQHWANLLARLLPEAAEELRAV